MSRLIVMAAFLAVISCMTGCVLDNTGARSRGASAEADLAGLRNDVKRLQTQVQLLEEKMDGFTQEQREDIAEIKAAVQKVNLRTGTIKAEVIRDVEVKLKELENRRKVVTNQLNKRIEGVVKEVSSMLRKAVRTTTVSKGGSGGSEKGFYHTVAEKENPWSIAQKYKKEYGVTTQAILDANGLKAGDPIRPGQKLFIPIKE